MKKKLIQCKDVFTHVCENLGRKLNSRECREIRRHLERCPNCTAYLDGLKKTVRLYRESPSPRIPNKVHRQLIATVKLEFEGPRKRTTRRTA